MGNFFGWLFGINVGESKLTQKRNNLIAQSSSVDGISRRSEAKVHNKPNSGNNSINTNGISNSRSPEITVTYANVVGSSKYTEFPSLPQASHKNATSFNSNNWTGFYEDESDNPPVIQSCRKTNANSFVLNKLDLELKYGFVSKKAADYIKTTNQKDLVCNNNRYIKVIWNDCDELEYVGSSTLNQIAFVVELRINFHGLIVKYSVQLLESILEFYKFKTHLNKLSNSVKRFKLYIDVGKGFSSAKGVPILGPKLIEYLHDIGMKKDLFVLQEGIITIQILYAQ